MSVGRSGIPHWPAVGRGMFGRLAACLAVWVLVLTGAAGASVVGATNVIHQGTKSGPGAYVLVG